MTTSVEAARPVEAAPFSAKERWVLLIASAWLVIGLQLDAYAHATTPELETFWTPWHGVLYSGIAASGFTLLWIMRSRLPGIPTYRSVLALPNALRLPLAGMAFLLVGGGVDTLWHNIWGIEQDMEIFVSPSHEFIILGMALVAMGPTLMLATGPEKRLSVGGAFLVGISTLFAALPVHIYSLHASAIGFRHLGSGDIDPVPIFSPDAQLIHGYVFSTILLLVPFIVIGRRWPLPFGLASVLVAVIAVLMHLMFDSRDDWWPALTLAAAAFALEIVLRLVTPLVKVGANGRWILFGLVAPPAAWGAVLLVGQIQEGSTGYNIHMLTGLLTLTALTGVGTVLVARSVQRLPE